MIGRTNLGGSGKIKRILLGNFSSGTFNVDVKPHCNNFEALTVDNFSISSNYYTEIYRGNEVNMRCYLNASNISYNNSTGIFSFKINFWNSGSQHGTLVALRVPVFLFYV